jgi:hypothetical protein
MKKMGFKTTSMEDGTVKGTLNLSEEEHGPSCVEPKPGEEPQTLAEPEQKEQREPRKAEALQE